MLAQYFPYGLERYAVGGMFIGLGVALLFITTGRLGGASSVFSSTWSWLSTLSFFQENSLRSTRNWRLIYALGMLLGGTLFVLVNSYHPLIKEIKDLPLWRLIIGGVLIGFGARLGGGCTSGHGICGIASLSKDSLWVVITFLTVAIVTAQLLTYLGASA